MLLASGRRGKADHDEFAGAVLAACRELTVMMARDAEGMTRGNRAKDYLVNTRGIDASRIEVVDGGCMAELKVELWVCPANANAPKPSTEGIVSPCPDCKKKPATRRPRRRGEE